MMISSIIYKYTKIGNKVKQYMPNLIFSKTTILTIRFGGILIALNNTKIWIKNLLELDV